jgi:hypothetical protein
MLFGEQDRNLVEVSAEGDGEQFTTQHSKQPELALGSEAAFHCHSKMQTWGQCPQWGKMG